MNEKKGKLSEHYEIGLMIISISVIIALVVGLTLFPEEGKVVAATVLSVLTETFGSPTMLHHSWLVQKPAKQCVMNWHLLMTLCIGDQVHGRCCVYLYYLLHITIISKKMMNCVLVYFVNTLSAKKESEVFLVNW